MMSNESFRSVMSIKKNRYSRPTAYIFLRNYDLESAIISRVFRRLRNDERM